MKIPTFIGGTDEQRSTNISDNKLINLYPVTNNDGSVTALPKVDGLKAEGTLLGVPTGAYKASNGRAFYTSGTTLYELTIVANVYTSTSRGTITTAINYEFNDNGLEMIMVNGTDGWIFTFATNILEKLTVITGDFTVQQATALDVDATLTKTSHGLIVGDRILLSTTGSLPANLLPSTPYYVLADSFTANSFKVGITLTGATCTISNATPAVITAISHGFITGTKIRFLTTGALPSPIVAGTIYYVISSGLTPDTFRISTTLGGTEINTTTSGSGVHSFNPAITVIQTGLVNCTITIPIASGTCTISQASPAVVTKTAHGFVTGDLVYFSTTGALPSPLVAGTNYYVTYLTADTFRLSIATATGNFVINTTTAGSGTHTVFDAMQSMFTATVEHGLVPGDEVILQSTGTLPTGFTAGTTYYVTGEIRVQSFANILYIGAGFLFSVYINEIFTENTAVIFYTNGVLPAGITAGKTYYLNVSGTNLYTISEASGGTPISSSDIGSGTCFIMRRNTFALSSTLAGIYSNPISGSGAQSGTHSYNNNNSVAYGSHSYTTTGYGFPNGAKQVSYMNGRFIAAQPNTQNFYVSEVLDGKTWDPTNVQTVDSNPDYVTGHIVSHNELTVFCENSGETYYDSGTTPTPFVRNLTGIFEAGCTSPYTIKEVDNSVFFLGKTNSGTGIVYRMVGLTPTRISTYSIEYAIQKMSDISDARALTYQKDGHHYYVLTFPSGNKTFVYDANTNLWHERAKSVIPLSLSWGSGASTSNPAINPLTIEWNGTLYCTIQSYGISRSAYTSVDGSVWTQRIVSSVDEVFTDIAWNGSVFCLLGLYGSYTSADGISWIFNQWDVSVAYNWRSIKWIGGAINLFVAVGVNQGNNTNQIMSSSDGIGWTRGNIPVGSTIGSWSFATICTNNSRIVVAFDTSAQTWTSTNGLSWTTGSMVNSYNWWKSEYGNGLFVILGSDVNSHRYATSTDGLTWTHRTLAETGIAPAIKFNGFVFCITTGTNNNTYISEDAITWTLSVIPGGLIQTHSNLGTNGKSFVTVGSGTTQTQSAVSTIPYLQSFAAVNSEWQVNKYLFLNNKHLVTDDTTTLYSIDSTTYKNGTDHIAVVRSFSVPTADMKQVSHHTLQIDCETGIQATYGAGISLRWSDDSGNTWSNPINRSLGVTNHAQRVIFRRLGITKGLPRIYELSTAEDIKIILINCYIE